MAEFARVPALAVRARRRFGALPMPPNVRFTDDLDLAELRRDRPEWRAEPLAPVDRVQASWSLPAEADGSLACLMMFELFGAGERISDALSGAARVLQDEGTLIISVPAEPELDDWPAEIADGVCKLEGLYGPSHGRSADQVWSFERGVRLMAALQPLYQELFEFELAVRIGREHVYVLVRRGDRLENGDLVEQGGRIYLVAEGRLRHVVSPEALGLVMTADQKVTPISDRVFAHAPLGEMLTLAAARTLRSLRP